MTHNIVVTFLGTTSGGGPTETRNCSSLVIDPLGRGSLWMVDCAEGTVRQFAQQPQSYMSRLRMSSVDKVFITHMHADHTMGVITLLRNVLGIAPDAPSSSGVNTTPSRASRASVLKVEVFGPVGLRSFVRTILKLTHTRSADRYCVHELLMPGESPSAAIDVLEDLHSSEEAGRNIECGEDGFWRDITLSNSRSGHRIVVNAGPIVHRDPCVGYIFAEQQRNAAVVTELLYEPVYEPAVEPPVAPVPGPSDEPSSEPASARSGTSDTPPRTVVVLGDTSDPSALIPLIKEDPHRTVSLLIHEATDAYMPPQIDSRGTTGRNRSHEIVRNKAINKGHSTPAMAGAFARLIGAERLALNHIGARFPAPPPNAGPSNFRLSCMRELEDQAMREWQPTNGNRAIAVSDFDRIVIPPSQATAPQDPTSGVDFARAATGVQTETAAPIVQSRQDHPSRGRGYRGHGRDRGHPWRGRGAAPGNPAYMGAAVSRGEKRDNDSEHSGRDWNAHPFRRRHDHPGPSSRG